jgi:hypothetical protein
MRDEDAWFVLYKGTGNYRLQPRNRAGWLSFAAFISTTLLPLCFIPLVREPLWILAVFFLIFPISLLVFSRFAKERARIIDLNAVDKDWDEFEAWRKRGKR